MYLGGIANLYRHRGQFVRAVRNGDTVTLCPLSLAELQNELECCFVFVRVATLEYLGGDDDGEIIDCPPRLVKMLMTYCNDCGAVPEIESAADIERVSE
jgi:hypothetical protein